MLYRSQEYSVWFTLGSEDETMVCLPVKVFKTLNDRQSYTVERLVLKDLKGCWFLFVPSFPKTNTDEKSFLHLQWAIPMFFSV